MSIRQIREFILSKLILLLFLFSFSLYAQEGCEESLSKLDEINNAQLDLNGYSGSMESFNQSKQGLGYLSFISNSTEEEFLGFTLEDKKQVLGLISSACREDRFDKDKCRNELLKVKAAPSESTKIFEEFKQISEENLLRIQETDEFKSLAYLKKHYALKYVSNKCPMEDEKLAQRVESYACRDGILNSHVEGLKDFSQDNLKVLMSLNLELNKTNGKDLEKSCETLRAKGIQLSACGGPSPKHNIADNNPEQKLEQENTPEQKTFSKEPENSPVEIVGTTKTEGNEKSQDNTLDTKSTENKLVVKEKKTKEIKSKDKKVKIAKTKEKKVITPAQKRNRHKFWKTTGTVAAAVGAAGLFTYGLYKLFEPSARSTFTIPESSTTTSKKTYQYYQMNQLEQYKYYQNMSLYSSGNSWIGSQNYDSTPYSFEYGF